MAVARGDGGADARSNSPARLYAKVVGVTLLLIGVVGLIAGDPRDGLFDLFNIDIAEDIIHLATGGLLTYFGFSQPSAAVKTVVTGLGAVYVLVGILGFIIPELLGLIPHEYSVADNILHLALGGLALAASFANAGTERARIA